MRKHLSKIIALLIALCFTFSFAVGCANNNNAGKEEGNSEIRSVYNSYVVYAKENGQTPLSYEEWLASIKGEDGKDGENGKDGAIPYVGENGNWFIDGQDTGKPSRGEDGESTSVSINSDGYWVIDGKLTEYQAEGNVDVILALLESFFIVERDKLVVIETLKNPTWNFTESTFSGWGGSIGKPNEIETITIKTRARDKAITKIKFFLHVNDQNGELLVSETLDVSIPAGESKEITWTLPEKIKNNTDSLFLAYNCDQFCDLWSDFSNEGLIPSTEYQAYNVYSTNGRMYNSAASMSVTGRKQTNYLYAKISSVQNLLTPKDGMISGTTPETTPVVSNKINVFLADEYELVVNDNFQLFYRGVVQAVNPYNYDISVTCSATTNTVPDDIKKKHLPKDYPRYFEWLPYESQVGTHTLTLTVKDDNGNVLGTDSTKLIVRKPNTTGLTTKNVLCIGDSLTQRGYWQNEFYRRVAKTGGSPEGLGLDCLNFIGTCNKNQAGVFDPNVGYEGYSGRHWQWYCGTDSPFYDSSIGDISFESYCEKNGYDGIDIVYFLLTWNQQSTAYKTNYDLNSGHFYYARKMIDTLHQEYPNAIIRCMGIQMPSQCGGMGYMYGTGSSSIANDYGMLVSAMNYNAALEDLCQLPEYRDFVKYVDVAGQFDTDYNMPAADKPANNRSETTEKVGTDGVHPSVSGYYQIADAAYRSLWGIFAK